MTVPVLGVFLAKITTNNKQRPLTKEVSGSHCCVKKLIYDLSEYVLNTVGNFLMQVLLTLKKTVV